MKKYIIFMICLQLLSLPAYSLDVIEDNFVESTLQEYRNKSILIEDSQINDNLINKNFIEKAQKTKINIVNTPIKDKLTQNLDLKSTSNVSTNLNYNYQSINNAVLKIKIDKTITTKEKPQEGSYVNFHTVSDLKLANGKIIPKNTSVIARIETVSQNDIMGVPANLVIDNFKINQFENLSILNNINKTGANRSLWVYPVVYVGLFFFGAGVLFTPIRGGHAKIKDHEYFELEISE